MRILLLTAMMIFASSASAGLYKWVDDEGNVHYSQKRPANQQFERLKAPPPAAPKQNQPLYQTNQNEEKKDLSKTESEKNLKLRKQNCEFAKKNLATYQIVRRVKGPDGKVIRLDDKERAKRIEESKEAINQFCN